MDCHKLNCSLRDTDGENEKRNEKDDWTRNLSTSLKVLDKKMT